MTTISACLVVYQEERTIADCLENISGLVDEIVVVHDGPCTDKTLHIARRYNAKIHETPERLGSSEFSRPLALSMCTADWVLVIDADERLSPQLCNALPKLVETDEFDGYGFEWPYVDGSDREVPGCSNSGKRFLFRRRQMYTVGLPHMTPNSYGNCKAMALQVYHRSDNGRYPDFSALLQKNKRRASAAARLLAAGIQQVQVYNASIDDPRVKNVGKIKLMTKHPFLAMILVPTYGFCYWYFAHGYFRSGFSGLLNALNLPLFYAYCSWYLLSERLGRKS